MTTWLSYHVWQDEPDISSGLKLIRHEGRLCFVASIGAADDWAVYYSDDPNLTPVEIAHIGLKTTQELGELLFPELAQVLEWRR